ncbi:MAG: DUF1150 family protein [Chloroflexota bacterium]|jgi:hypothetical protein
MIHDAKIIKSAQESLLELGDGQVAYMKKLDRAALEDLAEGEHVPIDSGWALFSAVGAPLAICDSAESAYGYANEMELTPVSLH